jgi:hypothetical protein
MSDPTDPGHPVGSEMDDSANPTEAAPQDFERASTGREMLVQLQQMIDTLATQAGPVMREVAAKAAELAAVAGEKAGPIAHKAAEVTESVGHRVAARSKEMAAELRRPHPGDETDVATNEGETSPPAASGDWPSEPTADPDD